ncbi:MAG TPA: hypothetical protein VII52_05775 [Gemmatimonadaceae bacterium]
MRIHLLGPSAATAIALIMFAAPIRAQTASATVCADGTTSTSTGKGTCSGHGGVDAKATSSVHTRVTCTDGTMSAGGRGACSSHGGVKSKSSTTRTTTMTKTSTRVDDNDATDAIALCKNGMYSHATAHRRACSKHGGVDKFLKP